MKKLSLIIALPLIFGFFGCDKVKETLGINTKVQNPPTPIVAAPTAVAKAAEPAVPKEQPVEEKPAPTLTSSKNSDILAVVNDLEITDAEVTERVKSRLRKLESQIFDIKIDGLSDVIEEKLLEAEAKKQNISIDALLNAQVSSKVSDPSKEEIETYYELVKSQLNNQPIENIKPQIVRQIKATKERSEYRDYIAKLRKSAKVKINMERPRMEVSVDDDPYLGVKDNAAITLIEFSDFQCPFCKRVRPTIQSILDNYKGKVKYVFRDFPLSFHKQAPKASEAANCAMDQGKYWEFNEAIWNNQQSISIDNLKGYAKELGLDAGKFDACLDSGKYASEIEKDFNDGQAAGVSGTPAYFINGIFLSGALPLEKFQEIIDEELTRLGS